jgi:hypothetical protein
LLSLFDPEILPVLRGEPSRAEVPGAAGTRRAGSRARSAARSPGGRVDLDAEVPADHEIVLWLARSQTAPPYTHVIPAVASDQALAGAAAAPIDVTVAAGLRSHAARRTVPKF